MHCLVYVLGCPHMLQSLLSIFLNVLCFLTCKLYFLLGLDQDSVRLLAVEGCAALGKLLEPQDCVAHILPVIVNFSQVHIKLDETIVHL